MMNIDFKYECGQVIDLDYLSLYVVVRKFEECLTGFQKSYFITYKGGNSITRTEFTEDELDNLIEKHSKNSTN